MGSPDTPKMTEDVLRAFSVVALSNAGELLDEATLLRDHGHSARAYFLAIASIEETGKALLAFNSQQRCLLDPAIRSRLKVAMESHSVKISYALTQWALASAYPNEALRTAFELAVSLKHGREPSMYSDLLNDPDQVQLPREVISVDASRDCVRLARDCLAYAQYHVREKTPKKFTTAENKLLTMKPNTFRHILISEDLDFWWYYLTLTEAGFQDFSEAVIQYERDYLDLGIKFRPEQ